MQFRVEGGDWGQRTDWHNIVVFRKGLQQSATNYGVKGIRALVVGRLSYNDYIDKDGDKRTSTHVVADDITFFHGQKSTQNQANNEDRKNE